MQLLTLSSGQTIADLLDKDQLGTDMQSYGGTMDSISFAGPSARCAYNDRGPTCNILGLQHYASPQQQIATTKWQQPMLVEHQNVTTFFSYDLSSFARFL